MLRPVELNKGPALAAEHKVYDGNLLLHKRKPMFWPIKAKPQMSPCITGLCPTEENALTVGAVYDRPFFLDSTKYGRS